jgi:peptide-methionine (R)-S-oxide reductase
MIAPGKIVEWRAHLTLKQFNITRRHGTERAGTSQLCACCREPLFASDAKFNSGTGMPSFDKPADGAAVSEHEDGSLVMRRTEVRSARCEAHLGHVFPNGPREITRLTYCINGAALRFKPDDT